MKKSELKKYIREIIISEVTMVGAKTDPSEAPEIAKIERTGTDVIRSAIAQAKKTGVPVGVAETLVQEMATFYKVKDKAGFKKALSKYKELKGDKYDKNALGQLLVALDKEGEVDVKTLAKEKGKDTATWNNPNTRAALEKEGGEFTDYVEVGKGEKEEKSKKEEPKAKKEEPKKEKPAPKKEEPKKAEEEEDEDDSTDDKAPSEADLKKIEKELSITPEEKKTKFNLGLKFIKKYKDDKPKIDAYLKKAKEEYKFPKNMMDDLKLAAGRQVD